MALYTFYITTTAIIDMVKYKKYGSPIMSMSKVIKMAAALVSMLSLETAMFSQFGGEMSPAHQRLMIALTGAGVPPRRDFLHPYLHGRACLRSAVRHCSVWR